VSECNWVEIDPMLAPTNPLAQELILPLGFRLLTDIVPLARQPNGKVRECPAPNLPGEEIDSIKQ
jgi:hypothetical protein